MVKNNDLNGKIYKLTEVLPSLNKEAQLKGLKVFIFRKDEIKKYFNTKHEETGVALLSRTEDTALYNLKNLRRCILVWPDL